jgi:hypothetical protein
VTVIPAIVGGATHASFSVLAVINEVVNPVGAPGTAPAVVTVIGVVNVPLPDAFFAATRT